jgi:hypothetical protein
MTAFKDAAAPAQAVDYIFVLRFSEEKVGKFVLIPNTYKTGRGILEITASIPLNLINVKTGLRS